MQKEADSASKQQANMLNYAYFNFELIALINTLPGATSAMSGQKALEMCKTEGGRRRQRERGQRGPTALTSCLSARAFYQQPHKLIKLISPA